MSKTPTDHRSLRRFLRFAKRFLSLVILSPLSKMREVRRWRGRGAMRVRLWLSFVRRGERRRV